MQRALDCDMLRRISLFQGLSAAELAKIAPFLHRATFLAGATLVAADEPGELAYIIRSGTVKVHALQADGQDVVLALLGPGELVGEMSLLDGQPNCASAVALEECAALALDRRTFRDCLDTTPQLAFNLAHLLSRRLRHTNLQIQALIALDLGQRMARQLLILAREYGLPIDNGSVRIPIRLTQSDLADLVGASRFRVNQLLVGYKQRGVISVARDHHITIHDSDTLARLAGSAAPAGELPPQRMSQTYYTGAYDL